MGLSILGLVSCRIGLKFETFSLGPSLDIETLTITISKWPEPAPPPKKHKKKTHIHSKLVWSSYLSKISCLKYNKLYISCACLTYQAVIGQIIPLLAM